MTCKLNWTIRPKNWLLFVNNWKSKFWTLAISNTKCLLPQVKRTICTVSFSRESKRSNISGLIANRRKNKSRNKPSLPNLSPKKSLSLLKTSRPSLERTGSSTKSFQSRHTLTIFWKDRTKSWLIARGRPTKAKEQWSWKRRIFCRIIGTLT